ncbi:L-threo-3-deoxy-hexylosonate aldolase like protein [Verticillium longisporum]|uniref:L-threo-3-deoxy-hexylosonate aldolase like protein n=1 Tax=Verticillium longisporum TaxID=100787 RepID=A0A8I2ZEN1_VERLO|nr:L-threo-3-deoxy-hexylosonate aldolase like protein [Verticillium longisporum]
MTASNGTNGHSAPRPLPVGIYAPTMTFFNPETEDLDIPVIKKHAERLARAGLAGLVTMGSNGEAAIPVIKKHAERLARAGLAGLVTMGSNGEAAHCTREEKIAVTKATREALDAAGFEQTPIILGATEGSVRGTIELLKLAPAAGTDYALILPPSYFRAQMDEAAVHDYFIAVADESPIPLILYNYPGAVSGIDMDSDLLIKLAEHKNIIGTKFTCGNNGKLTRVALATDAKTPWNEGSGYMAFGGMCDFTVQTLVSGGSGIIAGGANVAPKVCVKVDFTVQTLVSGGSGIIAGGANVAPKVCVKVWDLYAAGKKEEAIELQKKLSKGDWYLTKAAVPGTKGAINSYFGYGGYGRRPLKRLEKERTQYIADGIKELMDIENSL